MADEHLAGRIRAVSGSVVHAELDSEVVLGEMLLVGELRLQGEVIALAQHSATLQVYEETAGLAVGVAMWIFSDLKFQADMGIMLTFMFVVNMIAAIIFLPALCRWLLRPREKDDWTPRL